MSEVLGDASNTVSQGAKEAPGSVWLFVVIGTAGLLFIVTVVSVVALCRHRRRVKRELQEQEERGSNIDDEEADREPREGGEGEEVVRRPPFPAEASALRQSPASLGRVSLDDTPDVDDGSVRGGHGDGRASDTDPSGAIVDVDSVVHIPPPTTGSSTHTGAIGRSNAGLSREPSGHVAFALPMAPPPSDYSYDYRFVHGPAAASSPPGSAPPMPRATSSHGEWPLPHNPSFTAATSPPHGSSSASWTFSN
eukprot:m.485586 g.485586  ORF g.485586 m.485586 type:complete len:251 (+) comp23878_c0_seq1:462-1214(+)